MPKVDFGSLKDTKKIITPNGIKTKMKVFKENEAMIRAKNTIIEKTTNSITTKETLEGRIYIASYIRGQPCHTCERDFGASQTGCCPVCDNLYTAEEFEMEFMKEPNSFGKKLEKELDIEDVNLGILDSFGAPSKGTPKPKISKPAEEKYEITILDKGTDIQTIEKERPLTFEEKKLKIKQNIELVNYMAKETFKLNEDYYKTSTSGKFAITRMGCNKLAAMFVISTETISIITEDIRNEEGEIIDFIATAKVKAIRSNGSYVIITGKKAKSEYWSEKHQNYGSYNRHNLEATAETRAFNRAIQNAIGFVPKDFMVASYEEIQTSKNPKAFGGK